jgi:aldehyde:ferredoxin oxidoreductase
MGYTGKYLDIDLSTKEIKELKLDMDLAKKFIGGKGLGAKILYDILAPGIDPLGEENIILFMTGPMCGTTAQTAGRWAIVTKSPQTGIFLDSQIGGSFGVFMKRAGYDYILFRGKAEELSYLLVTSEGVELRSATDLAGKGTFETEELLQERHAKSEVACIGPAGENLVVFSAIMTGRSHMAGRGGAGAVMGSKNLKAVVALGSNKVKAVHQEKFSELTKAFRQKVVDDAGVKHRHDIGTVMWVNMSNEAGFLPTRNYQTGVFEDAEAISGETMKEKYVIGHKACWGCRIACGKVTKFTEGKYKGLEVEGPEYETTALIGSNCGINSMAAIAKASHMCDDLGIDTITSGATISFAMECSDKGILQQDDVENLTFGNEDALHQMLELIAHRKGIGDLFAKGSLGAANELGQNSEEFAIQVKGLELAGIEPRGSWGMALAYSTSDRGACHQRCWTPGAELRGDLPRYSMEGVPKFVIETQDERAVCGSLVLCDFVPFGVDEMVEMLNAATGFDYTSESYLETGARIWNLTRLFNAREGITAADDVLPKRFSKEAVPEGPAKGQIVTEETLDKAKAEYYTLRGWTAEGLPSDSKIKELAL